MDYWRSTTTFDHQRAELFAVSSHPNTMSSAATVQLKEGSSIRRAAKPTTSVKLTTMLKDYRTAAEQHAIIARYLSAAIEVLPNPYRELLLDFAETAQDHCERLHRMLRRQMHRERGDIDDQIRNYSKGARKAARSATRER